MLFPVPNEPSSSRWQQDRMKLPVAWGCLSMSCVHAVITNQQFCSLSLQNGSWHHPHSCKHTGKIAGQLLTTAKGQDCHGDHLKIEIALVLFTWLQHHRSCMCSYVNACVLVYCMHLGQCSETSRARWQSLMRSTVIAHRESLPASRITSASPGTTVQLELIQALVHLYVYEVSSGQLQRLSQAHHTLQSVVSVSSLLSAT